ncbi:MAG: tetratricopeptide repeat protein [Steroidobacteraceae bacterium]|nr:tetratricopeptide repeat protein [Steroidobacteraceae bacterium]MDW8257849.1 tetratricopeptide repeat protein [Gammaproteobacteria bacterium]
MSLKPEIVAAARALQERRFADAEAACRAVLAREPQNATAWHLLGLTRRSLNDLQEALECLTRSVQLDPANAEARTNLAQLHRAAGRSDAARAEFEHALRIAPGFRPARLALARLLNEAGDFDAAFEHALPLVRHNGRDAEGWAALGSALHGRGRGRDAIAAFREALAIKPDYRAAQVNLIAALAQWDRPEEALAELQRSRESLPPSVALLRAEGAALMQLDRFDEADAVLREALRLDERDAATHRLLAQLRYVRGDADFTQALRDALARAPDSVPLALTLADTLRRAGDLDAAEALLRRQLQSRSQDPDLCGALAVVLLEQACWPEALGFAEQALVRRPHDPAFIENAVAILLCIGEARRARGLVEPMLAREPQDQRWITYRIDAARLLAEPLAGAWADCPRIVRCYEIEAPAPWPDRAQFLRDVRAVLGRRHWAQREPLDQSLRRGTQSSRALQHDPDPVIQALLATFARPLRQYQNDLRAIDAPPLRRVIAAPALELAGCWSVRLRRGGQHVNHIHPQGAVSSAFYVDVPPEVGDTTRRSGWIRFGEPRWPVPGLGPQHYVQPREGMLVLFPSYLWHGTTPLQDDASRLTVAFDAVPAGG